MSLRCVLAAVAVVWVLVACGTGQQPTSTTTQPPSAPASDAPANQEPTPAIATPDPAEEPVEEPPPDPTPAGPALFKAGEVITVSEDDEPYLDIVVSKVSQKKSYGSGYFVDKPAKGNIYIQALITYEARSDGATYNTFDWQVFCDDTAIENYAFVSEGPEPQLSSGTLPTGRKAKGWVVYEIPVKGRCVLSYGANSFIDQGAVFEVLLRGK